VNPADGQRSTYDRSLRAVMWWDAFLSLEVALLAIVALPIVVLADLPRSVTVGVGVAAILAAIVLAACGIVTAVLIGLRMRLGDDYLPASLRLPLPAWMRPTLQDRSHQDLREGRG
jgi:hypothetical protein